MLYSGLVDPVANPYAPGAGQRPPELAGRDDEQSRFRILLDRLEAGHAERGIVLTGLRGVGKTVLLDELRSMAEQRRWIAAFVEAGEDRPFRVLAAGALTASLRATSWRHRSSTRLRQALGVFKSFSLQGSPDGSIAVGIDVDRATGRADSGNLELDLSELMTDLGEAAADLDTGVLLAVDELQALPRPDLAAILAAAHQMNRRRLPVVVAGAGLPNLPARLMDVKTYAERLFTYSRVDALGPNEADRALMRPAEALGVSWQRAALERTFENSGGYPYFLQLFGKAIWDFAPGPHVITAEDAAAGLAWARRELDANFYGTRWERATPVQRTYLAAMSLEAGDADIPVLTARIASRLGKSHRDLGPCRDQLIRKGLIYAPGRGLVAFTVPGIGAYINSLEH